MYDAARQDADSIREAARGRWPEILAGAGLDRAYLKKAHGPCPFCGGRDRWRFDDRDGSGTAFCSQCLPGGDGFSVLARHLGLGVRRDFGKLLEVVAGFLGISSTTPASTKRRRPPPQRKPRENPQARDRLQTTWGQSVALTEPQAEPARRYLVHRGLADLRNDLPDSRALRFHVGLPYWHGGKAIGLFSTLLAEVARVDGTPATIHRTYLCADGHKADVPGSVKKLMTPAIEGGTRGGAVRLYPSGADLAVAEGLETALAVRIATGLPVWSAISASGMAGLKLPAEVARVQIWADLDRSGVGQQAAEALAIRLVRVGVSVKVIIPPGPVPEGQKSLDWLDILNRQEVAA